MAAEEVKENKKLETDELKWTVLKRDMIKDIKHVDEMTNEVITYTDNIAEILRVPALNLKCPYCGNPDQNSIRKTLSIKRTDSKEKRNKKGEILYEKDNPHLIDVEKRGPIIERHPMRVKCLLCRRSTIATS